MNENLAHIDEPPPSQILALKKLEDAYIAILPFDITKPPDGEDGLKQQRETRLNFLLEYGTYARNLPTDEKETMKKLYATALEESSQLRAMLKPKY